MRSVFRTFKQPNRFKIARELYRKLVEADRLKEIFVITPTEKLEKYTWDDVRYFIHEGKLKERLPTAIPPESALVKLEQQPSLSLEHPSAGIFTQISEKKAEQKSLRDLVITKIEHSIEKELPNIKDLSKQSQIDALANVLINEQKKLLEQGYLDAASRSAYTKAVSNIMLKNPDFKMVLVEALQKAMNIQMEETNNEYIKLLESFKRIREHPSIAKIEEGRSAYFTETSPGYAETPQVIQNLYHLYLKNMHFKKNHYQNPHQFYLKLSKYNRDN
jgi:vacuolar-type H+-ATPase subunit I/STV1